MTFRTTLSSIGEAQGRSDALPATRMMIGRASLIAILPALAIGLAGPLAEAPLALSWALACGAFCASWLLTVMAFRQIDVVARSADRRYFLECLSAARSEDDLQRAGLGETFETILPIAAEALSDPWDDFDPRRQFKIEFLRRVHRRTDLRRIADALDGRPED